MKKSIFVLLFLYSIAATAQTEAPPADNSPYSRFGLGDFINQNLSANAGMGNLSASFQDPYHLNILNPAASAQLLSTAFEVGVSYKHTNLKEKSGATANANSGNVGYLALGFPLRNQINELFDKRKKSNYKLGMHLALMPYTTVGYNTQVVRQLPTVDSTTYLYKGTGGTYKLFWGNSIAFKDFAFGVNLGYLFGKTKSQRQITFNKLTDNYEVEVDNGINYHGFVWNLGTQYTYNFKKKGKNGKLEPTGDKLIFGLYGNSATNFKTVTDATYFRSNYTYYTSTGAYSRDTVLLERSNNAEGKGKLPAEISVGAMYQKGTKLRAGVNYTSTSWSKYSNSAQVESLLNAYAFSVGLEYTPEAASYNKYLRRVRYRLGANLWTDPRSIQNEQLKGKSVTVGFGLPLVMPRQQVSFVNIALEAGSLGTSVLEQNYFKATVGFTLNDNSWFYKRRYN